MKINIARFEKVISIFPKLNDILKKMEDSHITYNIGGSSALYIQGNTRLPRDVDIMFTENAHKDANKLFNLKSEIVTRTNVSMVKSSPVNDGSIDFLSKYTAIANNKTFYTPPLETTSVKFENRNINLMPSERIIVFKLIGRRDHHNDLTDFTELFKNANFDMKLFWEIVDSLGAHEVVTGLLKDLDLI